MKKLIQKPKEQSALCWEWNKKSGAAANSAFPQGEDNIENAIDYAHIILIFTDLRSG